MKTHVRGIDMAFDIRGDGMPLILLHAFPLNRTMWQAQIDALSQECKVIAPDLGGFGESDARDEPSSMQILAKDVLALMAFLKLEQAIICGLSMGGYVAFELFRLKPAAIKALILADTRAEADTAEGRENRKAMAASVLTTGVAPVAETMPEKLLGKTTLERKENVVQQVKELIRKSTPQAIANAQLGMMERPDSTMDLANIECPVQIIVGDEDLLTPVALSENMAQAIPNAKLTVIPHAGHLSNLEQPDEFNRTVKDFLGELK